MFKSQLIFSEFLSRVIGVLSGKGGVGKTTVVANLGAALTNEFNKNVLIFDSNIHTSHLGLHLGMYEDLPLTLREVLNRKVSIMNAVYLHPQTGIRLIPAPLSGDGVNLTKEKCCKLIDEVKDNYDMVIMDCSPGLGKEVMVAINAIDEALIVTTPDLPALADAMKTIDLFKELGKKVSGIVVNRHRNERYELTPNEIMSTAKTNVLGLIPEDKRIAESIYKGVPAVLSYPHSPAGIALKRLAADLIGAKYDEMNFFERLKRLFGFGKFKKRGEYQPEQIASKEKEIRDIGKLKEELTKEVKDELKRKIAEKVKRRLKERM